MLVDTHCHLDFDRFDSDRDLVIGRARQSGIKHILNPGIDLESSLAALKLADKYPEVYVAVGVHPNSGLTWAPETRDALVDLASHPKVVAIGEIGLDFYRDWAPQDLQRRIFREQLSIAAEVNLPVVIHTRDLSADKRRASETVLDMLAEWRKTTIREKSNLSICPGVLHSYSSGPGLMSRACELGFFIGITGPVTFRNAQELQEVVALAPMKNLLIETDAPFLTPHPHRGKRNEPANVRFVAEKIAQIRNLTFDTIADVTTTNAERLFHW